MLATPQSGSRRRLLLWLFVAVAAVLAAGVAGATSLSSGPTYYGCYGNDGYLKVVDSTADCKKHETAITWNQQGPKGDTGEKGDQGERGPSNGYEVFAWTYPDREPLPITGTSPATGTIVMTRDLPAGSFMVTGNVVLEGNGDGVVVCTARTNGWADVSQMAVGKGAGDVRVGTMPFAFGADEKSPGQLWLKCWVVDGSGDPPVVRQGVLDATQVGSFDLVEHVWPTP